MSRKACGRPVLHAHGGPGGCTYERMAGKQRCVWHWLLSQPAGVQAEYAAKRREASPTGGDITTWRSRVPKEEWPPGERWCSGCQSYVPLFYVSGSRCKSCNSEAAHAQRVEKVYDITKEEYDALFVLQGGRCYICQRVARSRRLAVDHDHVTNEVRGLLCSDSERGCNHAILGNIRDLAMAKRIVAYLEDPPYQQLTRSGLPPAVVAERVDLARRVNAAQQARTGTLPQEPPF